MITSIDDIPSIIMNNINDDDKNLTLIHDENDLNKCCFDLIKSGYHPKIKFQGTRLTDIYIVSSITLKLKFKLNI